MSEKTLTEPATQRVLDALARRAEAAEAFAEIAAKHYETGVTEGVYEAAERLLHEYVAAREAVRKLEEVLSNDDNS